MALRPRIFISAVSKELKSARQLVANTLQFLGYEPVWQDIFGTEQGDLREMLRKQIDECKGVVHLVGHCYGAEPLSPDEQFGRVSYTQYEALYARQRGMKVWCLLLDRDFPTDPHEAETGDLVKLQSDYRQRMPGDRHLFHPLSTPEALETAVLKMRSEFRTAWTSARRWAAAIIGLLVLSVALVAWLAMQAERTSRLATLSGSLDASLESCTWTEGELTALDAVIRRIHEVSPEQADLAAGRINHHFEAAVQAMVHRPLVEEADVARIGRYLDLLGRRDVEGAARLRSAFQERLRAWEPVLQLEPPFGNLKAVFPSGLVTADNQTLESKSSDDKDKWHVVLTSIRASDCCQIEAVFADDWDNACEIGLVLNAGPGKGYAFRMTAPMDPVEATSSPVTHLSTFKEARESAGFLQLEMLRDGVCLRRTTVPAGEVPKGPIRLTARREGERLAFQVNQMPQVTFRDIFPINRADKGTLGLIWPNDVHVSRLRALRQLMPSRPSPLEEADDQFATGRFAEALECYRTEANTTSEQRFRLQARYKEALCLLEINRTEEAETLLLQLMKERQEESEWPVRAGCRLWLLYLQQGKFQEAEAVYAEIHLQFPFVQLAALVPEQTRQGIIHAYCNTSFGAALTTFEPNRLRNIQRAVEVQRFVDVRGDEYFRTMWALLRAYEMQDSTAEGIVCAREIMDGLSWQRLGRNVSKSHAAREYLWLLRRNDGALRAIAEASRILQSTPSPPPADRARLLLSRSHAYAAAKQWDKAETDVDQALALWAQAEWARTKDLMQAFLTKGFLRQQNGDDEGAQKAWQQGLHSAGKDARPGQPKLWNTESGQGFLYFLMLGAMTGKVPEADLEAVLVEAIPEAAPFLMVLPTDIHHDIMHVLLDMWRTHRGSEYARAIVFQDVSFPDVVRLPWMLFSLELIRQEAFAGDDMSPQVEEVVWKTITEGYAASISGRYGRIQMLRFLLTWNGTTGALGWAGIAPDLEPSHRITVAYLLGHRYLQMKRPDEAAQFFDLVVKEAPADSPLRRPAQESLDRLRTAMPATDPARRPSETKSK